MTLTVKDALNVQSVTGIDAQLKRAKALAASGGTNMLPPAHIHARAKRYAVKLFLSHWHHVAYMIEYDGQEPPKPYILNQDGHTHFLAPPNWPMA